MKGRTQAEGEGTMPSTGFEILEHASLTDVGVRRSHNQDAYKVVITNEEELWRERGHLFLVADGMGAHAVGELASKLATDFIPHTYQKYASQGAGSALRRAFAEANATIHQRGQQNREFEGMGTTSTAVALRKEGAWIAHVGDSRAYRIRGGYIEQLSYDHSLQWELARRHQVDPGEIKEIPSNVIVRSLGPESAVQVDVEGPHPILPGDFYLVCSDGLSNQMSDQELGAITSALPLEEAGQFLVDLANLRGGPDNITVVLVRLPGESPANAEELVNGELQAAKSSVLFKQIPWAGIGLGAGTTMAVVALLLFFLKQPQELVIGVFVLAALTIVLGLLGLWKTYHREQTEERDEEPNPPQVYRRAPARVDQALFDKLAHTASNLEEIAREKGWQVDWPTHQRHAESARKALQARDLLGAFRAQCRAMALLTEVLRQHRNKEEVFQPLW
jgi:protein phosphatase